MAIFVPQMIHTILQYSSYTGVLLCVFVVFFLNVVRLLSERRHNPWNLPFPPGPKGYPLIGSVFEMPISRQWLKYDDWAKTYGDIFSFEVLGHRIIVLGSTKATQELFEKRSANYSDRPRLPMVVELMKGEWNLGLMPYGSWWRRHRRCFNEQFRVRAVGEYQPVQDRATKMLLNRLLESPEMFLAHIRHALASSIMGIVYGIKLSGVDDPYLVNIEEAVAANNAASIPGSFLVDIIPALKYVPSWFPGAGFKRKAAHWAELTRRAVELPFKHVAQQMNEGTAGPSIAAKLITALPKGNEDLLKEEITIAMNVTAMAYLAGADTTISAIHSFFLAMAMYPETQKKAQAELDCVIGSHRLPEFEDRPSLPYLNALIKEILRWQPVAPLAVPHVATHDDVYEGYFIPKGSILFGNSRAILHDERAFTNPGEFVPERYLKDGQLDLSVRQPEASTFGFGRRICPGRYFADNTLFSIISSTLWSFNIAPALDKNDTPIPLSKETTPGLISYPLPFTVNIKPRSLTAEALVRDAIFRDD